jgi:transposase
MRISGCRLKEKTQDRLAEFFCRRSDGSEHDGLGARQPQDGPVFLSSLRQIIARQLEISRPVEGLVERDESYFGGVPKGKRGRGAAARFQSSASSSAAARSTP